MAGIYIHIPFCASRCIYCDFYSTAGMLSHVPAYLQALEAEMRLRCHELGDEAVRTVYVGGGTPSLLSIDQMGQLVAALHSHFDLSQVCEFTVEVNPDDVTSAYIAGLLRLGVNRVSMGVQSFSDADLRLIRRRHTARQAVQAVRLMQEAGVANVSIDLIYGLPGQTLSAWQANVEQAVALGVQHISAYSLMFEPGTVLWTLREQGKVHEVSDDLSADMYRALCQRLSSAGFVHYEVSNFALPGRESLHNSNYWNLTPYLGLGAAAHSYDGHVRRHNPGSLSRYVAALQGGAVACVAEQEADWECYDEYVMLRLRTAAGLDPHDLARRFAHRFVSFFLHKAQGLLSRGLLAGGADTSYYIPECHVLLTDAITRELMWDA